ncbi:MAG: response regulator, partial [Vicinamibacterales bacterium]
MLDDDPGTCRFMQELLSKPDREVETTTDPEQALARCRAKPYDLVITDLKLNARLDGIDILRAVRETSPSTPVIIVTGFGELEKAVEAVREGAFDFVSKPFNVREVIATARRALAVADAPPGPAGAEPDLTSRYASSGLVGHSRQMIELYMEIARVAAYRSTVLV